MRERAIGDPAEPADDPALRVVQRLHFAAAVRRHVGVKVQIVEAGAALDQPELAGIEMVDVAEYGVKLVERILQSGVPLDLEAAIVARCVGKPDHGAGNDRQSETQQQDRCNAHDGPIGRAARPARPPPRPPFSGCYSGLHPQRPHYSEGGR